MEFFKAVNQRKSVRKYLPRGVSDAQIKKIMNTAVIAPSWKNGQCCRFIVIKDAETREKVAKLIWQNNCASGIKEAPVLIVMCALPEASACNDGKEYYLVDAGIAMEHIVLAASAENLGTCWIGLFQDSEIKKLLKIPDKVKIVAMTPLGYPDKSDAPSPGRMDFDKVVFDEEWKNR